MVRCHNCGKETDSSKKYCVHCGKEIKSNGKFKKFLLLFFVLLICILLINGALTYISSINSDDGTTINTDSQTEYVEGNLDSQDNSNAESSLDFKNLLSPSTKTVDFDGIFTMDVDENVSFTEWNIKDYLNSDKHWYYKRKNIDLSEKIVVFYWENNDLDNKLVKLESRYSNPQYEGDLAILTSKTLDMEEPSYQDYLVFVHTDDDVVAIQGHDLEKIKRYANSVHFT